MSGKTINKIVQAGLFVAVGILLPVVFHMFGLGSIFLPMHIPVLVAGMVISWLYAAVVGALTPVLSSVITGMPPAFPTMPMMVFELAAYGMFSSLLYRRFKLNIYLALLGSMVAGRIVAGIAVWILANFFAASLPGPAAFIAGAVLKGMPGIIIQVVLVPAVVMFLERNSVIGKQKVVKG